MRRKQKCGNEKRTENDKKAWNAAASAQGQKSLLCMFRKLDTQLQIRILQNLVSGQPTDELVQCLANKPNEIDDEL